MRNGEANVPIAFCIVQIKYAVFKMADKNLDISINFNRISTIFGQQFMQSY